MLKLTKASIHYGLLGNKNELYKLSVEEKRLAEDCREDFLGFRIMFGYYLEDIPHYKAKEKDFDSNCK